MRMLSKTAVIGAAVALTSQPCLAAAIESNSTHVVATMAASAAERVEFNLETHAPAAAAQNEASQLALAAAVSSNAAIAAQEAEERERRGMSKGAKTALIVGGVVLVGVLALALIAASSTPPSVEW